MNCIVCNVELPEGDLASCRAEGTCWEHCTDYVAHSSPALYDEDEPPAEDEDRAYDAAVDDAVTDAAEAGDIQNWRAYMRGGQ